MTSLETMRIIRMLLDDGRDYYPTLAEVVAKINDAQMEKIRQYYDRGDERALRPLYTQTDFIQDGDVVTGLLFPRACRLYDNPAVNDIEQESRTATYIEYDRWLHYAEPGFAVGQGAVSTARYTVYEQFNTVSGLLEPVVYFTGGEDVRAKLWYIAQPADFTYTTSTADTDTPLQLPAEYHIEVAVLAAEMLNDQDVGEMERGDIAFPNQRLRLNQVGAL